MADFPCLPFWTDAYLGDTTHLTTQDHGAYLLLLMAMWRRNGQVPDDDKDLARIVGLDLPTWRKTKRRLRSLLIFEDGSITQKRLRKEWQYVREKREKNSANGRRGGRPRGNLNNRLDKANGSPEETQTKPNPEPITHNHEKPNGFSRRAGAQKKSARQQLMEAFDVD